MSTIIVLYMISNNFMGVTTHIMYKINYEKFAFQKMLGEDSDNGMLTSFHN